MPSTFEPPTECGRDPMIDAITMFLSRENRWSLLEVRERLGREIDDAGPAALVSLTERLAAAGSDWAFYPRDPLARRIHHVLADRIIDQATLDGGEHLAAVADKRVVMIA